jgi:hypothetical protein
MISSSPKLNTKEIVKIVGGLSALAFGLWYFYNPKHPYNKTVEPEWAKGFQLGSSKEFHKRLSKIPFERALGHYSVASLKELILACAQYVIPAVQKTCQTTRELRRKYMGQKDFPNYLKTLGTYENFMKDIWRKVLEYACQFRGISLQQVFEDFDYYYRRQEDDEIQYTYVLYPFGIEKYIPCTRKTLKTEIPKIVKDLKIYAQETAEQMEEDILKNSRNGTDILGILYSTAYDKIALKYELEIEDIFASPSDNTPEDSAAWAAYWDTLAGQTNRIKLIWDSRHPEANH